MHNIKLKFKSFDSWCISVCSVISVVIPVVVIYAHLSPQWLWLSIITSSVVCVSVPPHIGLAFLIATLPFQTIIPFSNESQSQQWRLLIALICLRTLYQYRTECQRLLYRLLQNKLAIMCALWVLYVLSLAVWKHTFPQTMKQLLFFANIAGIVPVIYISSRDPRHQLQVWWGILTACFLYLAVGLIQFVQFSRMDVVSFWRLWADQVIPYQYGWPLARSVEHFNTWFFEFPGAVYLRMFSLLADSHVFGMVSVIGLLGTIFAYQFLLSKRIASWVYWLACLLWFVAAYLSGTRAVLVGIIGMLGFLLYKTRRSDWQSWSTLKQHKYIWLLPLFALAFPISYFLTHTATTRALTTFDLDEASNQGRIRVWHHVLNYDLHHPFGTGLGNFSESLKNPSDRNTSANEFLEQESHLIPHLENKYVSAHSLYLQILTELGWLGFCFAVLIFGRIYFTLSRRSVTQGSGGMIGMGLFVFMILYSIVDVTVLNDRILILSLTLISLSFLTRNSLKIPQRTQE